MLFFFLALTRQLTCINRIISPGTPQIYRYLLIENRCILVEFEDFPIFISYFCTGNVEVTKYSSYGENENDSKEFTANYQNSGKIERILNPKEKYIFRALEISNVTLTIASVKYYGCTDVYIENSKSASYSFSKNATEFFSTSPTNRRCYVFGADATQTIEGYFGTCKNCPVFELFEGQYSKQVLTQDSVYSHRQAIEKYPLVLVINAKENSDLEVFNMNVRTSSDMYPTDFASRKIYMNVDYTHTIIEYKNTGDILTIIFSALVIFCSIFLVVCICCNEVECCTRHSWSGLQMTTHGMNTQYPLTNGKNYRKYMDRCDLSDFNPIE